MVKLVDVLNKRLSTRNLSDIDFDAAVPSLAVELSHTSYYPKYTNDELNKDWERLKRVKDFKSGSQFKPGMKICQHFF